MKNLLIVCLLAPVLAFAQYENRSITVYGKAEKEIAPDEVWLYIAFSEYDKLKDSELSVREEKFSETLQKWNISVDQIEIVEFKGVRNDYYYGGNTKKVRFAKSFKLKLTDPGIITDLTLDLFAAGVNIVRISDVRFNSMDSMKIEVTKLAMENARLKARTMVETQGDKLGQTVSIKEFGQERMEEEYPIYADIYDYRQLLNHTGAVSRAVSPNEPDPAIGLRKVKIEASVRVVYQLE